MGELLARAFTEQALLDAWDEVRDAALEDGEAGAEVEQFEVAAARKISHLAESLADRTFSPHPVHRAEIAKRGGGTRRLAVPTLVDRIVERALLAELDAVIDPLLLPWSFAYRRGMGVRDALACLVEARESGSAWVARADIDDCFDCIPRWEVLRRLREVVADPQAVDLVRRLMDRPVVGERTPRPDRGLGLHQGSVLSPLLSNLYLDVFDRAMLAAGYRVIRYSDDMAIPMPDRAAAESALAVAAETLAGLRLDLDPVKSHVVSFDDGVPLPRIHRDLDNQPRGASAVPPAGDRRIRGQAGQPNPQPRRPARGRASGPGGVPAQPAARPPGRVCGPGRDDDSVPAPRPAERDRRCAAG
jgi:CRISPR-associated protein Cas1